MNPLSNDNTVKSLIRIASVTLAIALAGCASTGTTSKPKEPAPAAAPAPATSPTPVTQPAAAAPVAAPSGDMGTVVFFRESKFVGGAVGFKVREGEQELGKLGNGSYFSVQLPTGAHAFTVHSEAKDVLNLEVERGETYYVQGSISMGIMVGRPNLSPSDVATFSALKDKMKDSAAPKETKKKK